MSNLNKIEEMSESNFANNPSTSENANSLAASSSSGSGLNFNYQALEARKGKRTVVEGTQAEADELKECYDNLQRYLFTTATERAPAHSTAEWDSERSLARILEKVGNFDNFGFHDSGEHFLEYYEALYLMETERLSLTYHKIVLSLEQAMVILLGDEVSNKHSIYIVYSRFTLSGYRVKKHRHIEPTKEDCVWELLINSVVSKPIPDIVRNSSHFEAVKQESEEIKAAIKQPQQLNDEQTQDKQQQRSNSDSSSDSGINFNRKIQIGVKRPTESPDLIVKRKSMHYWPKTYDILPPRKEMIVDSFNSFLEFDKFNRKFETVDMVPMITKPLYYDNVRSLEITFDLVLNQEFKKSLAKKPTFHVIVVGKYDIFPTLNEITKCYQNQLHPKVPVLVVTANSGGKMKAFIYKCIQILKKTEQK